MRQPSDQTIEARWDAGDLGCGQLIVGLKCALTGLEAGEVLELVTRDAGAMIDIAAWCRITGHKLLSENHPSYIIRKKGDQNV